jgi:hypothetical protein
MAHASKTHFDEGRRGKKSGGGASMHIDLEKISENDILSNRDKSRHFDGNTVKSKQYQDYAANRLIPIAEHNRRFPAS